MRVKQVVRETPDASSFVLDVPDHLRDAFTYAAGQFCTFRVNIDGESYLRSYSMSSSPAVDADMQVTVKRVPDGAVSNWMNDHLEAGDTIEAMVPSGVFCLGPSDRELVAFAGGSGITPVFSLIKTVLVDTSRRARLLYANRDRQSVIFDAELEALIERYGDRLQVIHHLDAEQGFVDTDEVRAFRESGGEADYYICGPDVFMTIVEGALHGDGIDDEHINLERFTPADEPDIEDIIDEAPEAVQVTIELDKRVVTGDYRHGTTILQTARQLNLSPPFSCEAGNCATCMAKVVEGEATMHNNTALTDEEVATGWVLTCQAVPTTQSVRVVYGYEED